MQILTSIAEVRALCKAVTRGASPRTLGLVPTMGALHAGHLSLMRAARRSCDVVIATIFVNPLQFGPSEDFSKYPRTFDSDCQLLREEGVDLLFAPTRDEMYPDGSQTIVDVPEVGARLDGRSRPGHFQGVATVVAKLFHIVQPDKAFFGQKDAAQVAVLRAMVRDLNFDLELVTCPTVRQPDGLALSSRNQYLGAQEREQATVISRSLQLVERQIAEGRHSAAALANTLTRDLERAPGIVLEYAEIVDPATLEPVDDVSAGALIAVAARVGTTRLIDNLLIEPLHVEAAR